MKYLTDHIFTTFYLNGGDVRIYFYKDNRFELEDMQEGFGKNGKMYDYTFMDNFLLKESLLQGKELR